MECLLKTLFVMKDGRTALDLAREKNNTGIASCLEKIVETIYLLVKAKKTSILERVVSNNAQDIEKIEVSISTSS